MALQPFNVEALRDPGLGVAASLLGSGIANFSEGLRNRDTNRAAYARQLLINKTDEEEARLKLKAEQAAAEAAAPGKAAQTAKYYQDIGAQYAAQGAPPELVDAITRRAEEYGFKALGMGGGATAPVPERGLASRLLGNDVVDLGKAIGGGVKKLFDGDEDVTTPQQMQPSELVEGADIPLELPGPAIKNQAGQFVVGAQTLQPAPYESQYAKSPAGQQLTAETAKKIADAKTSGFGARTAELKDFSDEFIGKDLEMVKSQTGKYPQAKDIMGNPIELEYTPRLRGLRNSYARMEQSARDKIDEKVENSVGTLDALKDLTESSVRLRQSGWLDKAQRSGMMDDGPLGKVFRLSASVKDQVDPSVIADMELYNNAMAAAMAKVASLQGKQGISNKDIQGIVKTIGDPSMPTQQFLDTVSRNLGDMYGTTLTDAAKSGVNFDILHGQYKQLTGGKAFDINELNPSQTSKQLILSRYKQILGRGMNYQPGVKPAAPRVQTVAPKLTQETRQQRAARLGAL